MRSMKVSRSTSLAAQLARSTFVQMTENRRSRKSGAPAVSSREYLSDEFALGERFQRRPSYRLLRADDAAVVLQRRDERHRGVRSLYPTSPGKSQLLRRMRPRPCAALS